MKKLYRIPALSIAILLLASLGLTYYINKTDANFSCLENTEDGSSYLIEAKSFRADIQNDRVLFTFCPGEHGESCDTLLSYWGFGLVFLGSFVFSFWLRGRKNREFVASLPIARRKLLFGQWFYILRHLLIFYLGCLCFQFVTNGLILQTLRKIFPHADAIRISPVRYEDILVSFFLILPTTGIIFLFNAVCSNKLFAGGFAGLLCFLLIDWFSYSDLRERCLPDDRYDFASANSVLTDTKAWTLFLIAILLTALLVLLGIYLGNRAEYSKNGIFYFKWAEILFCTALFAASEGSLILDFMHRNPLLESYIRLFEGIVICLLPVAVGVLFFAVSNHRIHLVKKDFWREYGTCLIFGVVCTIIAVSFISSPMGQRLFSSNTLPGYAATGEEDDDFDNNWFETTDQAVFAQTFPAEFLALAESLYPGYPLKKASYRLSDYYSASFRTDTQEIFISCLSTEDLTLRTYAENIDCLRSQTIEYTDPSGKRIQTIAIANQNTYLFYMPVNGITHQILIHEYQ